MYQFTIFIFVYDFLNRSKIYAVRIADDLVLKKPPNLESGLIRQGEEDWASLVGSKVQNKLNYNGCVTVGRKVIFFEHQKSRNDPFKKLPKLKKKLSLVNCLSGFSAYSVILFLVGAY